MSMPISRRALLAASAGAAAVPAGAMAAPDRDLETVLADAAEAILNEGPEGATYRGVDVGARAGLRGLLSDRSEQGAIERGAAAAQRVRRLQAIDRSRLSGLDAVNYDCALEAHEQAAEGARFGYGDVMALSPQWTQQNSPYAATQMSGAFQTVPDFLDSIHPVETAADAEAYLARLEGFAAQLDQESARLASDTERGVVAPDFVIDTLSGQLWDFIGAPTEGWALVASLQRRARAKELGEEYALAASVLCEHKVRPAIERQIAVLAAARGKADDRAGVWKLPRGEAYYAWQLRCGTTITLDADAIHQMGLSQVAELEARMDDLLKAQGLSLGSVGARMAALGKDDRFLYPNTDEGRTQLIAALNGRIEAVRPKLADAFSELPAAPVVVRRVPPEIEAGAPLAFELDGSPDGSRPATYSINLKNTAIWPKFILPTLAFHETIPGHVWQGAHARGLPLIRQLLQFNAYTEGWALYAEQVADELGMYEDDPFGRLGYLQALQFRACRLVVDTGLHARRWSRAQALRYLVEHTGRAVSAMQAEVDRYCATPGQACGYKVGHTEINRLRDLARARSGRRFDTRRFNDLIVSAGSAPLTALSRIVEAHAADMLPSDQA